MLLIKWELCVVCKVDCKRDVKLLVCFFLLLSNCFNCMLFSNSIKENKRENKYKSIVEEYKEITLDDICLRNDKNKDDTFLFGVGTSSYQVEGFEGATQKVYNQWMDAEGKTITVETEGKKEVITIQSPLNACEHWKRYKEDIQLIKKLGCNAYRFSISWGKVEPKEGEFNTDALKHYAAVCKELEKNGIRPVITLYHYTHPVWFAKKGAFEKEENIKYFENYCLKVFEQLNKYDPIWFTINTFSGLAFHSYYLEVKPPFKKDISLALQVLKNALNAHVGFYRKAKKKNKNATIGIHKIVMPVQKYRSWQFWDNIGVSFINKLNHDFIYEFFTEGKLKISLGIPALFIKESIRYENKDAVGALDCVGLNYYSSVYVSNFKILARKDCIPTQTNLFRICPEGFYTALHQVHEELAKPLNVPIYVTENGIATDNDEHRDVFFRSHLQSLSEAIQDGIDVRGYIAWSLMDNFDWLEGYDLHFGLYAVDRKTQERKLKNGTDFFISVIKNHTKLEKAKQEQASKVSDESKESMQDTQVVLTGVPASAKEENYVLKS